MYRSRRMLSAEKTSEDGDGARYRELALDQVQAGVGEQRIVERVDQAERVLTYRQVLDAVYEGGE